MVKFIIASLFCPHFEHLHDLKKEGGERKERKGMREGGKKERKKKMGEKERKKVKNQVGWK